MAWTKIMSNPKFFGTGDLAKRWGYTVRGVRNLAANEPDFPEPAFAVNGGRIRVWEIGAIQRWENAHPETRSGEAKAHKSRYGASFRKRNGLPYSRSMKPPTNVVSITDTNH
jgi:hypothetical protein